MTDTIREQSKWARERTKIVVPYIKDVHEIASATAGKGFSSVPGYLYAAQMLRELELKWKLSDINFEILSDTIERELKQHGITYDIAFKTAQMAWELKKQKLLNDWAAEYGAIQYTMEVAKEDVERLAIALYVRKVYLIAQKAAIEEDAEEIRNEIAELGRDEATKEAELATAKLLTATKKLELIPVLEDILTQELLLIEAEKNKNTYETTLIAKLQELAAKKQSDLLPALSDLLTALENYKQELEEQRIKLLEIAELHRQMAAEDSLNMDMKVELSDDEVILNQQLKQNDSIKLGIDELIRDIRFGLTSKELPLIRGYIGKDNTIGTAIYNAGMTAEATWQSAKTSSMGNRTTQDINNDNILTTGNINNIVARGQAAIDEVEGTTLAKATASITSNLVHILS